ncbi:unnamed protein product [Dibothriocephalus latus]|uniref:Fibronectin type-III domain-containing protein n=1 Tax=Dibothriocephalus latus TaxID=60516 RepID=A0A3P6UW03_DIBLA|nr:unnamed protein product [Dibothriocephalus latus]
MSHLSFSPSKRLAPSSFTATALQNQSIRFAWETPKQNLGGLKVVIKARNNTDLHEWATTASQGAQTGVLDNLKPLTLYNTGVSILNMAEHAETNCSQAEKVVTFPTAPKITIADFGGNWIWVKFEPMEGAVDFDVEFNAKATDGNGIPRDCSVKASNQEAGCYIEQLEPLTNYAITATACVDTNCSLESSAEHVTTLDKGPASDTTTSTIVSTENKPTLE